jgi:large subunit ribosomal protein L9
MQIVLFKNIERLGMQGDIVNVAPGYYRNYLGPHGIAAEATEGTLRRLSFKRKKLQAEADIQRKEAQALAGRLAGVELAFARKATDTHKLFGSVSEHDILDKLKEAGFEFERRQLLLREPIKTTGVHHCRIRLESNLTVDLKVTVEPEGAPVPEEGAAPTVAAAEAPPAAGEPDIAGPSTEASAAPDAT